MGQYGQDPSQVLVAINAKDRSVRLFDPQLPMKKSIYENSPQCGCCNDNCRRTPTYDAATAFDAVATTDPMTKQVTKHIFVAVTEKTIAWPFQYHAICGGFHTCRSGAQTTGWSGGGWSSAQVFTAVITDCNCTPQSCPTKCTLNFRALKKLDSGVAAMSIFMQSATQGFLYMANFRFEARNTANSIRSLNRISVADLSFNNSGEASATAMWTLDNDRALAGGYNLHGKLNVYSQVSKDGVGYDGIDAPTGNTMGHEKPGDEARFAFYYVNKRRYSRLPSKGDINFDRYAAVSLATMVDSRTLKRFLLVVEGSTHKVRMVDVTANTASKSKVLLVSLMSILMLALIRLLLWH